ncbi:MAG: TetR family transcriptional regulator [Nocardia sp.]|nr:TetR family transcriptional regulator [Nocardia sp.]
MSGQRHIPGRPEGALSERGPTWPYSRPVARKSASAPTDDSTETGAESKAVRTRKRILDAAAYVLSRKGYAGTRLSEVAEIAELQAPAIYYYFPSKDDLVEEVMWAGIADMNVHVGGVLAAVPAGVRPMDRILVAVEAHMRHELEISDYTTASIRNAGQVPEKIRVRQLEEEAKYGKMWRSLFDDAVAAGELRPELDPVIARMLVLGALNWAAEWWTPERGSLDTVVRTAQDIVRNGLSPGR